jgi:hypothetical protein
MVGTGERAEKIRTYNYPQNRVTDHRIQLTLHKLDRFMDGELDELIVPLRTHHQAEQASLLEYLVARLRGEPLAESDVDRLRVEACLSSLAGEPLHP